MATSMIAGMSDAQWDALVKGAQAGRDQLAQTGTFNGATPNQNLAAVINQPGNTTKTTAQPYITPNGTTDYHVSGQPDTVYGPPTGGSVPKVDTPVTTPTPTATPVSAGVSRSTYQPPDYAALAAARTAAALAQKRSIAQTQKASLDRSFARDNQITNDNRALENGQINRTLSPFSGKTAFDKGMIGRERTLVDENKSGNLAAQKAGIDDLLAAYESATADEQVRIMDELQARDRQYQLDLSQQTGTMADGTRNLAGQQFDWNTSPNNPSNIGQALQNTGQAQQNILNQFKIDDYPAERQAAADKIKRDADLGKMDVETATYNLKQLKDPNSTYNQAAKIDLDLKNIDLSHASEKARLEIQQLQKQIAQIGVVHYKPQTEAEKAQDKVTLATANKQLADIANGKYPGDKNTPVVKPITSEEYQSNLKPQYDNHGKLTNAQQIEDQIILSGMSEWEQYKSYKANGIPWTDPIPTKPN